MNIKLIYPAGWYRYNTTIPLGITTLAASLKERGASVSMSDLELECFMHNFTSPGSIDLATMTSRGLTDVEDLESVDGAKTMVDLANLKGEDVVGISVMGRRQVGSAILVSASAKKQGSRVVWGGDYSSNETEDILNLLPYVDAIVRKDGITALQNIAQSSVLDFSGIPNATYRISGKIKHNPPIEFPALSTPAPLYEGLPLEEYIKRQHIVYGSESDTLIMQYLALLGCVNKCAYCPRSNQHSFDTKPPEKVVREIMQMSKEHGSLACKIEGNELNPNRKFLEGLVSEFLNQHNEIKWSGYAMLRQIDYEILSKAHDAGCLFLRWGVESGSQNFHDRMLKGYNISEMEKILHDSKRAGIFNLVIFMLGTPYETDEEVAETVSFIKRNAEVIDAAKINMFGLAKGSELYRCPEKFGINLDASNPSIFHEQRNLNWEDKQKKVAEHMYTLISTLVDVGVGQSGTSSDLVFTSLLENTNHDAAKQWLKDRHPLIFELLPNYMASWYVYHRLDTPSTGSPEQIYQSHFGVAK